MHWVAEIVYMVYKQIISRFLSLLKLGAAFKRKKKNLHFNYLFYGIKLYEYWAFHRLLVAQILA